MLRGGQRPRFGWVDYVVDYQRGAASCSSYVLRVWHALFVPGPAGETTNPDLRALPIIRPLIMVVTVNLVLPRNWFVQIEARTAIDLLPCQIHQM